MDDLFKRWQRLKKTLDHTKSIAPANVEEPKDEEIAHPHPDDLSKIKYGYEHVPGATSSNCKPDDGTMGFLKKGGRSYVVRHGAAAHRAAVEHEISKLVGADHMLAPVTYDGGLNHPKHHNKDTFDPHHHGGTAYQEHVKGDHIADAMDSPKRGRSLREQWKNGDLHKLWGLHYITNNADMHPGNYHVDDHGVKAFDSDHAYYELPFGHVVQRDKGGESMRYMPNMVKELPSYLAPFIHGDEDFDIKPKWKDDQVAVKQLNDHADKINPQAFEAFGPHVAERARRVKSALASTNPTDAMLKLWAKHQDRTKEVRARKPSKEAA